MIEICDVPRIVLPCTRSQQYPYAYGLIYNSFKASAPEFESLCHAAFLFICFLFSPL